MAAPLLAFFATIIAALIAAIGIYVGKKLEMRAAEKQKTQDVQSTTLTAALEVLQGELSRKSAEVAEQNLKLEQQSKDIAELRVSNWLVLEHLLNVHRHFAEGNPPPPPPMPDKLLDHLREV